MQKWGQQIIVGQLPTKKSLINALKPLIKALPLSLPHLCIYVNPSSRRNL